ncbi:MAG TPA: GlmU family protein [Bacteroidia bacterium]|nr:GlmU family protein [Bacteroidia bacterium]
MTPFRLVLFDDDYREQLLPLAWTRPVADFRIGIFTIREKWEKRLSTISTTWTSEYLAAYQWPFEPDPALQQLWINARVLPSDALVEDVRSLKPGEVLLKGEMIVAVNAGNETGELKAWSKDHLHLAGDYGVKQSKAPAITIHRIHDLFTHNGKALMEDFELLKGTESRPLSKTNVVIGNNPVFLENDVIAECCVFNTVKGPVYIGKGAEIMEGSLLRGPLAIGNGATVKMGAKIYGDTTIGPGCKVGGEIVNSIFFANSNKAHDGFLGNSVIGEWCNLGADTNCSNLKNNYGSVGVWNYAINANEDSGLQFHGLIMADHAKCGINTMFNTGTVAGVASNIFGGSFPPKFIPDFAWGGVNGFTEYQFEKVLETIQKVYGRRAKELGEKERVLLRAIFQKTAAFRAKIGTD